MKLITTVGLITALALPAGAAEREGPVDVERFHAAASGRGVTVSGGDLLPEGGLRATAVGHFANEGLGVYDESGKRIGSLLDDRLTLDTAFAYGVLERLELSIRVPVVLSQAAQVGGEGFAARAEATSLASAGLGDPALAVRFRALSAADSGLDITLGAAATAPVSGGSDFLGEPHATVTPHVGLSRKVGTTGWLGLDLGYRAREDRDGFYGLPVGDELGFGISAAMAVSDEIDAIGELYGATLASSPFDPASTPVEAIGAGRFQLGGGVALLAGGGFGLTSGYGTPVWRAFAGASFGTGGSGPAAGCELGPEDFDGFADEDGCLDPDDDGDGLADVADRCPELAAGPTDANRDGCPDGPDPFAAFRGGAAVRDRDRDGIADEQDLCISEPEDSDGFQDDDGCPDPDNDNDSVLDFKDRCPNSAGDPSAGGCPPWAGKGGGV